MNNTARPVLCVWMAAACVLAAQVAQADRVSFGLGVGNGSGFFSLGVNNGGRGHCGPSYYPHGHGAPRFGMGCTARMPPPFVYAPPPVVVVAPSGYWQEREERVWIEGYWSEAFDAYGRRCKQWQPGRWEIRRLREWVQQ